VGPRQIGAPRKESTMDRIIYGTVGLIAAVTVGVIVRKKAKKYKLQSPVVLRAPVTKR